MEFMSANETTTYTHAFAQTSCSNPPKELSCRSLDFRGPPQAHWWVGAHTTGQGSQRFLPLARRPGWGR
eukprot:11181193-Lingulodinium_polyedra.AAC.1